MLIIIIFVDGENLYGGGVYFANDASYPARNSVSRPDPTNENRKRIYLANVITGHFCAGQKGMIYLPERMTGVTYDCLVDNISSPQEFVMFNDTQSYPMHCIEFIV